MKQCCRCGAELNDNVWKLFEYGGEHYCESCLLEQMQEEGVVDVIEEEENETDTIYNI